MLGQQTYKFIWSSLNSLGFACFWRSDFLRKKTFIFEWKSVMFFDKSSYNIADVWSTNTHVHMIFIKFIGLRVLLTQRFSEKKDLHFEGGNSGHLFYKHVEKQQMICQTTYKFLWFSFYSLGFACFWRSDFLRKNNLYFWVKNIFSLIQNR